MNELIDLDRCAVSILRPIHQTHAAALRGQRNRN